MTPQEEFQKAFAIISNPKKWTQGVSARDIFGRNTGPNEENAVRWCSIGILWYVTGRGIDSSPVYDALQKRAPYRCVSRFNDSHTHKEVVDFWRKTGECEGWL